MYALGFPALVPCEREMDIYVEVYRVDIETLKRMDELEGYPHYYDRVTVDTPAGEAWIYVIRRDDLVREIRAGWRRVESGDYTEM